MSLINEALKKAQSDTSRGSPPNPMAGSLAGAHVRTQKKSPFLKLVALAAVVGVAVWAGSFFLGSSDSPQPVVEVAVASPSELEAAREVDTVSTPVESVSVAVPETPTANSVPEVASEPAPEVAAAPEVADAPVVARAGLTTPSEAAPNAATAPTPEAPAAKAEPAVQAVAETVPAVPPAEPEVEAVAPPTTDQALRDEIIYTLKQLEITAVMGDGSKARIMSGGQIHRAGELINLDLKIRFRGKKGKTLYFTDPAGEIYEKSL